MATLLACYDENGRIAGICNEACYNAKHDACLCCCMGANHGVGLEKAVANTQKMGRSWMRTYEEVTAIKNARWEMPALQLSLF